MRARSGRSAKRRYRAGSARELNVIRATAVSDFARVSPLCTAVTQLS